MAKMIKCKTCGEEIAKSAKTCPHCGAKNKKSKTGLWIVLGVLVLFIVIANTGKKDGTKEPDRSASMDAAQPAEEAPVEAPEEAPEEQPAETKEPEAPAEPEKEEFKEPEIKEYGYAMNGEYLYYALIIHNPNETYCAYLPSFRVTARDADGGLLGTEDQTLSVIYPGQDFYYGSMAFKCEGEPASVEIEMKTTDSYKVKKAASMEHPEFIPLEVENATLNDGKRILGEIRNDNDYAIEDVVVSILYRDENGTLLGGACSFVDDVAANTTTPFDVNVYTKFATENYEIYANNWV